MMLILGAVGGTPLAEIMIRNLIMISDHHRGHDGSESVSLPGDTPAAKGEARLSLSVQRPSRPARCSSYGSLRLRLRADGLGSQAETESPRSESPATRRISRHASQAQSIGDVTHATRADRPGQVATGPQPGVAADRRQTGLYPTSLGPASAIPVTGRTCRRRSPRTGCDSAPRRRMSAAVCATHPPLPAHCGSHHDPLDRPGLAAVTFPARRPRLRAGRAATGSGEGDAAHG